MKPDCLWVFLQDRPVGQLVRDRDGMQFTYLDNGPAAISVTLPRRDEPYPDQACRPFFQNLLPEGAWRQALCRALRIPDADDFRLLAAIGVDCAGAVALHDDPDWRRGRGHYRPLAAAELRRWVLDPTARPRVDAAPGLRLSLAGAQDKILIHLDDAAAYQCENGAPSTVILKPDIDDRHNAVELSGLNELLTMQIARACGLRVAEPLWYSAAYAVRRFDRREHADGWARLHQEDFAQISRVSANSKYEADGGPGWRLCFGILDNHARVPARDRLELLARLMFNLCIGNNDAHAKNFALLHDDGERPALAPAYDLLNTQVYPRLAPQMAMTVGGAATLQELNADAWARFGAEVGLRPPVLAGAAGAMTTAVRLHLPTLLERVESEFPEIADDLYPARRRRQFFHDYSEVVTQNCARLDVSFDRG